MLYVFLKSHLFSIHNKWKNKNTRSKTQRWCVFPVVNMFLVLLELILSQAKQGSEQVWEGPRRILNHEHHLSVLYYYFLAIPHQNCSIQFAVKLIFHAVRTSIHWWGPLLFLNYGYLRDEIRIFGLLIFVNFAVWCWICLQ